MKHSVVAEWGKPFFFPTADPCIHSIKEEKLSRQNDRNEIHIDAAATAVLEGKDFTEAGSYYYMETLED